MKNNPLVLFINLFFSFFLGYILLFTISHFLTPNIGQISVHISSNTENPEIQEIQLTTNKPYDKFYILIYEHNPDANWIYLSSKLNSKSRGMLLEEYLPTPNTRYLFFEGNKEKTNFKFSIKPKYSIGYMTNKEHAFHLFYIIPHKLLFFPSFYYSKHLIFFIDPIMS